MSYSRALQLQWLKKIEKFTPDDEVKRTANQYFDTLHKEADLKPKERSLQLKEVTDFINKNKLEAIKNFSF
jgi:hypothetical protein